MRQFIIITLSFFILFCFSFPLYSQSKKVLRLHKKAAKRLEAWRNPHRQWNHVGTIEIDTLRINPDLDLLEIDMSTSLSYLPIREENYQLTVNSIRDRLGRRFRDYTIRIRTDGKYLQSMIPNYYRKSIELDTSRFNPEVIDRIPIVRRVDNETPAKGLYAKNIALWPSHGWYYEAKLDRWEWQRARLYSTVEDIFPLTFVLPYLTPMLENAGANVFLPRERDTQINEVIVDYDGSSDSSEFILSGIVPDIITSSGFKLKDTLFVGENPFNMGNHLRFKTSNSSNNYIDYIPHFTKEGNYAVYISHRHDDQNIQDATYVVNHTGGTSEFLVNQQIGGGTWIYLGTFRFRKGKNPKSGSVRLLAKSDQEGWITSDAVRFGGGMGNVARKPAYKLLPNQWSLSGGQKGSLATKQEVNPDQFQWKTSKRPRYQEGARYYLQFAGAPDTLVYSLNEGKNDYNDDYQSRGEWVNYLMGAPEGPNVNRNAKGLNIPIDLSLAFHTDAGITPKDSIIGTLAIYSSIRDEGKFPSGQSKMVSRDLSDIIQTEIVHDIRKQFKPDWSRRGLWNKEYSEAWRPNVPAMLLELMSHQNLTDVGFALDPRFKFAVSRAIYKGIVKFLAFQNNTEYVIQPLPIDHFSLSQISENTIRLSWEPVLDSLECTAIPAKYKVYQRIDDGGFDNGKVVYGTSLDFKIDDFERIYSFKVAALNEGGESFASEILSVGLLDNDKRPVLVVNAFDRVAAPAIFDEGDFAGIARWEDEGVPDKFNIGYTGEQYDFNRKSPWLDDDSPGWGASYGNREEKLILGNSFDNTVVHGEAIMDAGYSFISTSDEVFSNPDFEFKNFKIIDLIFGEEKTTTKYSGSLFNVFDRRMQQKIIEFTEQGGHVFASGAYIGTDPILNGDTIAQKFANEVLHFAWRTNHAVKNGNVYATDYALGRFKGNWNFNTTYHPTIYKVEAPDAIEPSGTGAITAFRYAENNTSAGIAFDGNYKTLVLGFPFETIIDETEQKELMRQILNFFSE